MSIRIISFSLITFMGRFNNKVLGRKCRKRFWMLNLYCILLKLVELVFFKAGF